jgi:peptidoglycan/xylan/chitin deacetylase (PgdA/CDA1 family)
MSRQLKQLLVGLFALPLSILPFVFYCTYTPEGRLVRDRAIVALRPPRVPTLTAAEIASARAIAPHYRNAVAVLAYHGVGSTSDGEDGFVVSPGRFASHLVTLRAAGFHDVTAREVAAAFNGGPPLPDNAVLISFDDGRTDAMLWADPLLEQAHMRATMFVITGAAEKHGLYYASWEQLRAASRSGRWDLQSHTSGSHHEQRVADGRSLPALTSLAPHESLAEYRQRIRDDLARASGALERNTGERPVAFAYPFGAYGAERSNNKAIRRILREEIARRYEIAFEQDRQTTLPLVTSTQNRLELRRLEVGNWTATDLLRRIGKMTTRSSSPRSQSPLIGGSDADQRDPSLPFPLPNLEPPVTATTDAVRGIATPVTSLVPPLPLPSVPTLTPTTSIPPTTTSIPSPPTTVTTTPEPISPPVTVPSTTSTTTKPGTTSTTTPTTTTTVCANRGKGRSRC